MGDAKRVTHPNPCLLNCPTAGDLVGLKLYYKLGLKPYCKLGLKPYCKLGLKPYYKLGLKPYYKLGLKPYRPPFVGAVPPTETALSCK